MLVQSTIGKKLANADLHVHSQYSEHPSEWFLKRLGAKESYTDPEAIYRMAKSRGMDYVTITDHNRIDGSLLLRENHPDDTFTGVEFTTYFPEDGCKVHILVYGLDRDDFDELQRIRPSIYSMRDCLRERDLAHSVAHATYPVNGLLSMEHLEKLILMFNLFEGINGGRNGVNNRTWTGVLEALDEDTIERLTEKHGIKPHGETPWIKGLTGGSDDHAGLFVGRTFTGADVSSPEEYVDALRRMTVVPAGRDNTYQALVFSVYKIAYEFSRQSRSTTSRDLVSALTEFVFEKRSFKLREKLFLKKLAYTGGRSANLYGILNSLIDDIRSNGDDTMERKLDLVYERIADLTDEFIRSLVGSVKEDITQGDIVGFITSASASLPGIFLSLPFFTAVSDMFSNKTLLTDLSSSFRSNDKAGNERRVMWFTDTLTDLNGVSVTLQKIASIAASRNPGVRIVTALSGEEMERLSAKNVLSLPYIETFSLPGYEKYLMKVPSVLKSLDIISRYEPDEIFVSTPGPVGLVGLLVAKLMNIKATGFFHTDYPSQATKIVEDESVNDIIENFTRWFYSCFSEVRVPTDRYIGILKDRGYSMDGTVKFRRGIDTSEFVPMGNLTRSEIEEGSLREPVMVYTGRVSRDKDLDVVVQAYRRVLVHHPSARLLIVGDGPCLEQMKKDCSDLTGVVFLGRIENHELPQLYSSSDLFVFPSESDTFGMSVLEAQACGLPAIVSSIGGPGEIISDGVTGLVARAGDVQDWTDRIRQILDMRVSDVDSYCAMRNAARKRVLQHYDWNSVYGTLFENG